MSIVINEPIVVHISNNSMLVAFIWRRRLYKVMSILRWWREPSRWWTGEPVRLLVRVIASHRNSGTYELCKREADWFLHRLLD